MYLPSSKFTYTALQSLIDGKTVRRLHGPSPGQALDMHCHCGSRFAAGEGASNFMWYRLANPFGTCKFWQGRALMSWGVRAADNSYLPFWKLPRT